METKDDVSRERERERLGDGVLAERPPLGFLTALGSGFLSLLGEAPLGSHA